MGVIYQVKILKGKLKLKVNEENSAVDRPWRRKFLDLSIERAMNISGSRKGYWRLADTPQLHKALGINYWES